MLYFVAPKITFFSGKPLKKKHGSGKIFFFFFFFEKKNPLLPKKKKKKDFWEKKKREKFDFGLENTRDTDLSRYFVTEFF